MVKLNPNKRERVTFWFFEHRMSRDAEQYAEKGENAVLDYVPSETKRQFDSAVKELENIGCLREVLFCNLYRLKHATDQHLPTTRRMRAAATAIANVAADIRELQRARVPEVVLPAYPFTDTAALLANPHFPKVLDELGLLFSIWWMPRKDLLTSYARVANSLYPTLASSDSPDPFKGERYFGLIINLFDAFGYSGADAKGEEKSLSQGLNNFHKAHPSAFQFITEELWREHGQSRRHEFTKRRKHSAPLWEPPSFWCSSTNSVYSVSQDFDYMMQDYIDRKDDTTG